MDHTKRTKLRICFITDYRSVISRNWIRYFSESGHEIHVISPHHSVGNSENVIVHVIPYALAKFQGEVGTRSDTSQAPRNQWRARIHRVAHRNLFLARLLRDWLAPLDILPQARHVGKLLGEIEPDILHAMRVPFEGIVATMASPSVPLIVSIWGNDFTLHARDSLPVNILTRKVMRRTDALHSDCQRDLVLSSKWGFDSSKPMLNLPGSGGIDSTIFNVGDNVASQIVLDLNLPIDAPIVINPRGPSAYVRNDVFFRAARIVLNKRPDIVFLCPAMKGNVLMEEWLVKLRIRQSVRLLPRIPHHDMAELFRRAAITVSLATHDGTPNSLLEAMACGCFPIVGNISSMHEWIRNGENGFICSPHDPEEVATAILSAVEDEKLREFAREFNLEMISKRADYVKNMNRVEEFYREVLKFSDRK